MERILARRPGLCFGKASSLAGWLVRLMRRVHSRRRREKCAKRIGLHLEHWADCRRAPTGGVLLLVAWERTTSQNLSHGPAQARRFEAALGGTRPRSHHRPASLAHSPRCRADARKQVAVAAAVRGRAPKDGPSRRPSPIRSARRASGARAESRNGRRTRASGRMLEFQAGGHLLATLGPRRPTAGASQSGSTSTGDGPSMAAALSREWTAEWMCALGSPLYLYAFSGQFSGSLKPPGPSWLSFAQFPGARNEFICAHQRWPSRGSRQVGPKLLAGLPAAAITLQRPPPPLVWPR